MSLAISATTHQGIIVATDSRQSYRNRKGHSRVGSDSVSKLFQLTKKTAVAITGIAFMPENGIPRNIEYFINLFKKENSPQIKNMKIKEIAEKLSSFFHEKYDYKKAQSEVQKKVKQDLKNRKFSKVVFAPWKGGVLKFSFNDKQGKKGNGVSMIDPIRFLVAGFDNNGSQKVYFGAVPGEISPKRDGNIKGIEYGADWIGQTDVVSRVVLGFDPRIERLPVIQSMLQKEDITAFKQQFNGLEYVINWGTMALQDAIDFCTLCINTTEAIQRFSDGIAMDPGDMPGVGGEVDIALITANDGFSWIKHKELRT